MNRRQFLGLMGFASAAAAIYTIATWLQPESRNLPAGERSTFSKYSVDAVNGDDSHPGSLAAPWKSIATANKSALTFNDQILFRYGQTWRETLTVPCQVGAYGLMGIGAFTSRGTVLSEICRFAYKSNSLYYILYERRDTGIWKLGYYISQDGIDVGRQVFPLLSAGGPGTFDEKGQADPSITIERGTWRIWYDAQNGAGNWTGLGQATSSDGLTWMKFGNNPILQVGSAGEWDKAFIHQPIVIKHGSTYYMIYEGSVSTDTGWKLGLATSSDGGNWTKYARNPILSPTGVAEDPDKDRLRSGTPFYYNNLWHMIYVGLNDDTNKGVLMLATSPDLQTWTKRGVVYRGTGSGDETNGVQGVATSIWRAIPSSCGVRI